MYNKQQIEPFFEKVHKEASNAAQKVYDRYNSELIERVKKQMGNGHTVFTVMGTSFVEGTLNDEHINLFNDFFAILCDNTQYWDKVNAGFSIPYKIEKQTKP